RRAVRRRPGREEVIEAEHAVEAEALCLGRRRERLRRVAGEQRQDEPYLDRAAGHPAASNAAASARSAAPMAPASLPSAPGRIGTSGRCSGASTAPTNARRAGSRSRSPADDAPPPTTTTSG